MKNNKLDNKGMTLIELVVIIAIMAVLTASFAVSITLISKQRVSNAANDMKSTIQLAQTYAKSRGSCYVSIKGEGDSSNTYIYIVDSDGNVSLGNGPNNINKKITTVIEFDNGDKVTLQDGMEIKINFNRSTGGFATTQYTLEGTNREATPMRIVFTNGEKETALWLAKNTGLVTFDAQR